MSNKNNTKKLNNIYFERKTLKWYYFIPLLLIVSIIPLITRGKYIELEGVQALFWKGMGYHVDVYSYWKSFWLLIMCIFSLVFYLALCIDKKLPFKSKGYYKYYVLFGIYIVFVLISSISSYYPEVVYSGFVDMYQGTFVLITYILLTFLMINYVNNENDIILFSKAFMFLIIIEGMLGLGQYFGSDFFKSQLGLDLIIPDELIIESSTQLFGKYTIYGTMYNTNFVGSFAAIIVPLSIAFYVNSDSKKMKILSGIALFLSACLWIGCNSRAGYIGIIFSGILAIFLLKKQIIKNYKFVLTLLGGLLIIIISLNFVSGGRTLGQFSELNFFKELDRIEEINTSDISVNFEDIILKKDYFTIVTNLETLTVKYENNEFIYLDNNSNKLEIISDEDKYIIFKDEKYKNYKIIPDSINGSIDMSVHNRKVGFYFTEDGARIVGSGNRLVEPIIAPTFKLLNDYERFASGRGYIWSRSIMMLPDVIYKGYGPDTFTVAFPQDDFIAKLNLGWEASRIVDKPHNMYLQIAINTGIISLLALLALWGIYLITSLKLYKGMIYDSTEKCIGFACFMAVLGYLVAGMFNDQIVSVAPLFWITLGLGISINERLKYKNKA